MSEVKKKCQVDNCSRAASTRCFCCNKNVCTRHFTEHIAGVKAQIDPLENDVNTMVEKIKTLTVERLIERPLAQLKQWKTDMHQLVDEIFLKKTKEIEELVENNQGKFVEYQKNQLEGMMKMQDDVRQLAEDGDATFDQIQSLKSQLTAVETKMTSFEKDFLSVNAQVLADGLLTLRSNLRKISPPLHKKSNLPPPPPPTPPPPSLSPNPRNSQKQLFFSGFGSKAAVGQQSSTSSPFGTISGVKPPQPQTTSTSSFTFGGPTANASSLSGGLPAANASPFSGGEPAAKAALFFGSAPTANASPFSGGEPAAKAALFFGSAPTANASPFSGGEPAAKAALFFGSAQTANTSPFLGSAPTPNASPFFSAASTLPAFGSNPTTSTFGTSHPRASFSFSNNGNK